MEVPVRIKQEPPLGALMQEHTLTMETGICGFPTHQMNLPVVEETYLRSLENIEMAFGKEHILTLDTVNNLGVLYVIMERPAKAEAVFKLILEVREKKLGQERTSTSDLVNFMHRLYAINNLGVLYFDQGKLAEAEAMSKRVLDFKEKTIGKEHTSTLATISRLGVLYFDQRKLVEAETIYTRALQIIEKAFSKDSRSTLTTVSNLGILYYNQGKLVEAETMIKRALEGNKRILGQDHISTVTVINILGHLYHDRGG